jgi:hypothetical protein
MSKIKVRAVVVVTAVCCLCTAYTMGNDNGLIRVTPAYHEAISAPATNSPADASNELGPPTPREQMYVFWLLGKALSYPIDKIESYILLKLKRSRNGQTPINVSSVPNPFEAADLSQVPPAPPVIKGAAATHIK